MFRLEPERTPWDVNFAIAGFPVRIHPFFWLGGVIFGALIHEPIALLCWMGVLLVSITIHERGHALAFRRFGIASQIVLYGMGGLCIPVRESYRMVSRAEFPWNNIFISFAGPLAGFILAGLIVALIYGIGVARGISDGITFFFHPFLLIGWEIDPVVSDNLGGTYGSITVQLLLHFNIFWGLINLLPVYPLDGGQIARSLFQVYGRGEPIRQSLFASMIAAGVVIVWALFAGHQFIAIMFAFLAFNNYQELRVTGGGEGYYG